MKSVLLAFFAIGVPLALMLVINWATSGPAPAVMSPAPSAEHRPESPPGTQAQEAPRPQPRVSRPNADLTQKWPAELVPAVGMRPLPGPMQVRKPPTARPPAPAPGVATTTRPTTAPSAEPRIMDRIEDWLEDWQQQARKEPGSQREAAAEYLARGDYERAAAAFDHLLLEKPNDADLIMGEVMALTRLGRNEDALPLLMALLEREPKNTAARYHYGVTLTRLDRREEAITAFTRLLEIQPAHGGAMFNLAILQQSLSRNQDAWKTWRKLTEQLLENPASRPSKVGETPAPPEGTLSPELACQAWFHRGEAEMAMSQVKEAQKCFLEVTRLTPGDARAWCNLGIARAVLAEYDEALPALTEALRLEPSLIPAMNQLAYIHAAKYRDTGLPEEKQAVLEWCAQSLTVQSQQSNIRELSDAVLAAGREPVPDELAEPADDK